jgi:alanine dehydrogenase
MPLTVTDHEVRQILTMQSAIAALEKALKEQASGQVILGERVNMMLPNGWIRLAPAALLQEDVLGYKEFHLSLPVGVRYTIHLFEASTGQPLAQIDAQHITAMRTGATSAIATKYLAPASATTVGVVGSGAEARTQLEALACVWPLSLIKVFSPNAQRRARFAEEMSALLGLSIIPVSSVEEAVEGSDLLIAATFTRDQSPVLFEGHLRPGIHLNSIGSTLPNQRELDATAWPLVDRIVVDTPLVLKESGDALVASQEGTLDALKVVELQDIVAGKMPGRSSNNEITLFKSVGTALQDVATGYAVYKEVLAQGLGREIAYFSSIKSAR